MSRGLDGRIVVITGGASGIGEATARALADCGATVVIADVVIESARRVAGAVNGHAREIDVTDADAVEQMAKDVEREIGPVEVVVTAAGITQRPTPPEDFAITDWDAVMDVDVRGTWSAAIAFGTRMARRGHGSVVTVASVAALRSTPLHAYGPAKAAVAHMTANLAAEWGRSGVRVNCVAPGYTRTPLLQNLIDRGDRDPSAMNESSALGRLVEAKEVAAAITFLAGDEASAITGQTLPVDAGWTVTPSWSTYGGLPAPRPTTEVLP